MTTSTTDTAKRLSDAELAKLIMSWVFGETQPNHGDVFSWLDDHVEDLARFLNKSLSPSAPVVAPSMTDLMVTPESIDMHLLREACDWPQDLTFKFLDEPGEHDPCYVIMPGGAMLPFAHHDKNGVDQARAQFIVDACNEKIAAITQALTESSGQGTDGAEAMREAAARHHDEMEARYLRRGKLRESEVHCIAAQAIRALPLPVSADGKLDHRSDCQLYTVPTYGLCTCDFDQRKAAQIKSKQPSDTERSE